MVIERALQLRPIVDVDGEGPHYRASSACPWLALDPVDSIPPGRWFLLRYRLGFYDHPVRPIISYRRGCEEIGWALLPGPVLGCGEGIGVAPVGTTEVWISPIAEPGPFSFALEAIQFLSLAEVLRLGMAGNRSRFFGALATFVLGWRPEAELNFRWAVHPVPRECWEDYRKNLSVASDLAGFDRPRCDWSKTPMVRLLARLDDDAFTPMRVAETVRSLIAQHYPHWRLTIIGHFPAAIASPIDDPRVTFVENDPLDGGDDDLLGFIGLGDLLMPQALACFIEAMRRAPRALVAYCDEETSRAPMFKPDWSPRLEAGTGYVGRMVLARLFHARGRIGTGFHAVDAVGFRESMLRGLDRKEVLHIPRILIETKACPEHKVSLSPCLRKTDGPHVTIVMPTRDRPDMMRRSVASLFERTLYPAFDLVMIDNGSSDPQAMTLFAEAVRDPRISRINAPGAFNFSHLCNLGAAKARGEFLVFLNNDVEIIQPDWLDEMVSLASDPRTGAVGCLLLYPDDRIQHAGIVVGLGDEAGHMDSGAQNEAPGWLGRNHVAHEVSAVTGACLVVERTKFESVGGFDAVHLPVEFNDIDLCLRLEEFGFQTMWTPFARLVHFESSSRGKATFRRLSTHASERRYFRHRWAHRLRDDPFYHPGLSLFSLSAALA
jgi:GT2 family glycosyltransferase